MKEFYEGVSAIGVDYKPFPEQNYDHIEWYPNKQICPWDSLLTKTYKKIYNFCAHRDRSKYFKWLIKEDK